MTFKRYRGLVEDSKAKRMSGRDHGEAGRYQCSVPIKCPKCGAQTRDPFGGGLIIHDVEHKLENTQ